MPRRYVPPRTGWASHMPNATVAVGAGLEPAHAVRRSLASNEVRYRSAHPTDKTTWRRRSDLNGWCLFKVHSALAVRCLRPLGHVSLKSLVGMERFELSRAKALVSKTSVSPISTTSPQLSNFANLDTLQPTEFISTNSSANGGLPGTRTLKMTQLLRLSRLPIPPEARKNENPSISRGVLAISSMNLNQPHPSVPSKSLRLSDRYDLNRFFTKTSIPQFQILCNPLSGNYPK